MRRPLPIASGWFQGAILTFLFGFVVLGVLTYLVYQDQPPLPARVVAPDGRTLFTRPDILAGMNVFQRRGLMEYGTVYGHGAYLGPDFTTDYLHRAALFMINRYSARPQAGESAADLVIRELHQNTYEPVTGNLPWSAARSEAFESLARYYQDLFNRDVTLGGVQARLITDPAAARQLTAFFAWTAWTATATRPGKAYSYTNNWPSEPLAGNSVTGDAIVWSAISIIGLLGGTGLILFFFGRYDWLGWSEARRPVRFSARSGCLPHPRPAGRRLVPAGQLAVVRFAGACRWPCGALPR